MARNKLPVPQMHEFDNNEMTSPGTQECSVLNRRDFVGMLSAGGAGLMFGPTLDQFAKIFDKLTERKYAFDLPAEWVERLGQPLKGYAAFVGGLQLKHLTVRQVIEPHLKERDGVLCGLPPAGSWKRMKPTLLMADEIGRRLGEKVDEIVSAYRSPAYNSRCPGAASGSQHMRNVALDIVYPSSPAKVARVAREVRAQMNGFLGGIGSYSGFTHIDTRGTKADW